MNQRIQELAEQATHSAMWLDDPDAGELNVEKFAELIVRECMDIISNQSTLDTNEDFREGFFHGRKLTWTEIRKRFGVAE